METGSLCPDVEPVRVHADLNQPKWVKICHWTLMWRHFAHRSFTSLCSSADIRLFFLCLRIFLLLPVSFHLLVPLFRVLISIYPRVTTSSDSFPHFFFPFLDGPYWPDDCHNPSFRLWKTNRIFFINSNNHRLSSYKSTEFYFFFF